MRFFASWIVAAVLLLGQAPPVRADSLPGSFHALEALAFCHAAARETDLGARARLLDRGLAEAEAAVAADDADAAGHFAIFCNLGRRLQLRPLGWGSLANVRRVRRAIDRALRLAPDSPQALTGKAVLLLELPRLLGGDAREGERLLRRALEVAPGFPDAARALATLAGGAPLATARR